MSILETLDLIGPVQVDHTFTCVSGQRCVLKELQYDMSLGDAVLVLDSCGKATSLVPQSHDPALALPPDFSFSWGSVHQTLQGGKYRLCWCSTRSEEATNPDNVTSPCQTADHFAVDFGSLHVVGPASNPQPHMCSWMAVPHWRTAWERPAGR